MALDVYKPVDGQRVSNRARWWVHYYTSRSGFTWQDIDSRDDISGKTFWNFVSGGRNITLEKLGIIAEALHVDITELLKPIPTDAPDLINSKFDPRPKDENQLEIDV